VAIAAQGVAKFKKEKFEVIIVDTSGRHKQERELFEEMKQIGSAVKPDMTVLILDASIGKWLCDSLPTPLPLDNAFQVRQQKLRAVLSKKAPILGPLSSQKWTDMPKAEEPFPRKGFPKYARAAINLFQSVAATKTPIIFLGTGEHLTDLDRFSPQPFISKLLGLGDVQGLMEHMQDLATQNPDRQKEMAKKLEEGKLSIRDWREQIQNVMNLYVGPCVPFVISKPNDIFFQGTNIQDRIDDSRPFSRPPARFGRRGCSPHEAHDIHHRQHVFGRVGLGRISLHGIHKGWQAYRPHMACVTGCAWEWDKRAGGRGVTLSISDDGKYGKTGRR
jgi:hypothetical protein